MADKKEKSTLVTYKVGKNFKECDTQCNFWGLGQTNYAMLTRGGSIKMEPADAAKALDRKFIEQAN